MQSISDICDKFMENARFMFSFALRDLGEVCN